MAKFILIWLLFSITVNSQIRRQSYNYDEFVTVEIHPSIPKFVFHIIAQAKPYEDDSTLSYEDYTYIIINDSDGDTIQVIEDRSVLTVLAWTFDEAFFLEDINFDGYKDFRYLFSQGATANQIYFYWLYNPKTKKFYRDTLLADLENPSPNPVTKEISSFSKCGGGCWTHSFYKYSDNGIIIIKYISSAYSSEVNGIVYYRYEFGKLINEKMEIIREVILTKEEFNNQMKIDLQN